MFWEVLRRNFRKDWILGGMGLILGDSRSFGIGRD
jgi:hypothetical protein